MHSKLIIDDNDLMGYFYSSCHVDSYDLVRCIIAPMQCNARILESLICPHGHGAYATPKFKVIFAVQKQICSLKFRSRILYDIVNVKIPKVVQM